jgi:hypothetical protein
VYKTKTNGLQEADRKEGAWKQRKGFAKGMSVHKTHKGHGQVTDLQWQSIFGEHSKTSMV